ncbi:hypothetical protein [Niameybacter massiliensis]|uniref:hypothetical protein n=1 Tax=Niameybacter massiliensis TaxID=1658108 RepID=UPI0006B666A9|nr:hypothetical protein [Niameybacter massiliensis]
MVLNEAEYEMYIDQKVKNLIQDETARIIDNRRPFVDWADAYSILKEEIEETLEEVIELLDNLDKYWNMVKLDAPNVEFVERLKVIGFITERIIHEAKQVGAVSNKAIDQLQDNADIDIIIQKLEQMLKERNKKAPITDQSK